MSLMKMIKSLSGRHIEGDGQTPVQLSPAPVSSGASHGADLLLSAVALHKQGILDQAETQYYELLQHDPDNADALQYLGMLNAQRGLQDHAIDFFQRALSIAPHHFAALFNLGKMLFDLHRFESALQHLSLALTLRPDNAQLWLIHGNALHRLHRTNDACASYRRALEINPGSAEVHYQIGNALRELGHLTEAEAEFRAALAAHSDFAEAHCSLGITLGDLGKNEASAESCCRALAINPAFAEAHCALGKALVQIGRHDEAVASYRRALEINPELFEAVWNLSIALRDLGQLEEAVLSCRRVLQLNPEFAEATWNLSLLLLAQGKYVEAWSLHESRYHPSQSNSSVKTTAIPIPKLPFPQWRGESLRGKSVLICPEQGAGDYVQFARYAKLLKQRGVARLTLLCPKPLKALLETVTDADLVTTETESISMHDFWSFPLSLPLHFGTTLENIPVELPYLSASPVRQEHWRKALPADGFKVGLVWKGSALHANDFYRSMPDLAALAPLWNIPGVTFISLQKGQGEEEARQSPFGQPIIALGSDIIDFADTAAIVSLLDLVICVDTAVAHVAGALNKPCWVLLPAINTDWRWLQCRSDSPWYPGSMRLFRQSKRDWSATVIEVANALRLCVPKQA